MSVSGRGRVRRSGRWRDNVPGSHHQMISLTVRTLHTLPIIRHHSDPIRGIMSLGLSHDGFDGYNGFKEFDEFDRFGGFDRLEGANGWSGQGILHLVWAR